MNKYNVLDFGTCNDGSRLTTKELQNAIDKAFETSRSLCSKRNLFNKFNFLKKQYKFIFR